MVVGAICFIVGLVAGAVVAALVIKNNPERARQAAEKADKLKEKVG